MRLLTILAVTAGVLVSACSQATPPPAPKPDLAAEEQAIRDADARWLKATQARDASGEAAVFDADGIAYREHTEPLVGPAAYEAYQTKFYADNPKAMTMWSTDRVAVAESGDIAIQTGEFHTTGLGAAGDGEDKGRFVTVWKKTDAGWKVVQDMGSTTMPEAPAATKP